MGQNTSVPHDKVYKILLDRYITGIYVDNKKIHLNFNNITLLLRPSKLTSARLYISEHVIFNKNTKITSYNTRVLDYIFRKTFKYSKNMPTPKRKRSFSV